MKILTISDDKVFNTWELCVETYLQYGRKLSFPKSSDPRKTYQWRFAKALAIKFEEWQFNEEDAKNFVKIAVAHAKEGNRLNKGLAALHQGNLIQICYDKLKKDADNSNMSIDSLIKIKKWLDAKIGFADPVTVFLHRKTPDVFCNLVVWVQASCVSTLYLALSKSCGKALAKIASHDEYERKLLPTSIELYKIRHEFLNDFNLKQVKTLLQKDFRGAIQ